jgi:hypothetical protein
MINSEDLKPLARNIENAIHKARNDREWRSHLADTMTDWLGKYGVGMINQETFSEGVRLLDTAIAFFKLWEG